LRKNLHIKINPSKYELIEGEYIESLDPHLLKKWSCNIFEMNDIKRKTINKNVTYIKIDYQNLTSKDNIRYIKHILSCIGVKIKLDHRVHMREGKKIYSKSFYGLEYDSCIPLIYSLRN